MVYDTNAMILVEIGEPTLRQKHYNEDLNEVYLNTNLNLLVKIKEKSYIQEAAIKHRSSKIYNSKLHPRSFHKEDLVWPIVSNARKHDDKFLANWVGHFCVLEDIDKGAHRLERLSGKPIPNNWNVSYLKFYFNSVLCSNRQICNHDVLFPHSVFFAKKGFG